MKYIYGWSGADSKINKGIYGMLVKNSYVGYMYVWPQLLNIWRVDLDL